MFSMFPMFATSPAWSGSLFHFLPTTWGPGTTVRRRLLAVLPRARYTQSRIDAVPPLCPCRLPPLQECGRVRRDTGMFQCGPPWALCDGDLF
jgi:hypothetical protein